jgi:hypothetical protein
MFRTVAALQPKPATEQSAYDRWMDQSTQRQHARNDRVHTAVGIIPTPLWLALYAICVVIFSSCSSSPTAAKALGPKGFL